MTETSETLDDATAAAFESLDGAFDASDPAAALDRLVAWLDERGDARGLLDALLLRARHDLGLPLVQVGSLADIPEPTRSQYEDRYVEAIRRVGRKLLDGGDLVAAWPYYRVLGEREEISRAIDDYRPSGEPGDERLGQVVDVAFNQGVNPRKGFELILDHYGACSAITAFEHLPPDEPTRIACIERLVRNLHDHLVVNLRADISRRGQPSPPEGTSMRDLLDGRDWLFADEGYHIDLSHLGAVVRMAPLLSDPESLALAVGLTEYGRRLSDRHRYAGEPPFEDTYADHGAYLKALVGEDVDAAVAHFRAKLPAPMDLADEEPFDDTACRPQVLVRAARPPPGRLDEAIDVASEHLAGLPDGRPCCTRLPGRVPPSSARWPGRPDPPGTPGARERRRRLVHYAAAEALSRRVRHADRPRRRPRADRPRRRPRTEDGPHGGPLRIVPAGPTRSWSGSSREVAGSRRSRIRPATIERTSGERPRSRRAAPQDSPRALRGLLARLQ